MRSRGRTGRALAVFAGLTLLAAGCGGDDDSDEGGTPSTEADAGSEGEEGAEEGGALSGAKGTTPLVDLGDDFKAQLDEQGLKLAGTYNYGAESYDAVVIVALAAEAAKSDGIDMARQINAVTRGGTKCTDYAACVALAKKGTDLDYDGKSGPGEFSGNGEPTEASYGVQTFGGDNRIADAKTVYKSVKAPAAADVDEVPVEGSRAGDGTLKIGTLLPETGSLAFLGPSMRSGVRLAIAEINAAGGVLGKDVVLSEGDSSDAQNPTVATQTVDRELGEGADVIVGAASSAVTLNVIDKVVGAGVVMFSPANTSKKLSTYADKGLFFRDAPSDILQGQVLGEVLAEDGVSKIGLLVLNDAYGTGLAEDLEKSFSQSGGEVVKSIIYDPKAQTFDSEVDQIKSADPDAIVLISFDEASRILATMVEKGIGPADVPVYGVDGWMGNTAGENFDAGK